MSTRTPTQRCTHCGYLLDAASHPRDDDAVPRAGDVSLCMKCGKVSVFNADLTLRQPTKREAREFATDPKITQLRNLIHTMRQ